MERITQLTNKSNQFNLTTKRYNAAEMQEVADSPDYVRLYGKLADKFGDNGLVSVVIASHYRPELVSGPNQGAGYQNPRDLHIVLWLMSCRVLKRDMELAMLDRLVEEAKKAGIEYIYGYYYPTAKNGMVKDFYDQVLGFEKLDEDEEGNKTYRLEVAGYQPKTVAIEINGGGYGGK
jgi:FkbH-like protein